MIPGFIITWLTFPGVIIHEFAHKLFCHITGTRVIEVCYFRFGNPAGYVVHEQPSNVWKHILIGIGPLFVNSTIGFFMGLPLVKAHVDLDRLNFLSGTILYLAVSIAMHSFPSTGDARSIWNAVFSKAAPNAALIVGAPLVVIIYAGAIGSIFWLDLIYGYAVVMEATKWFLK
jgi:hypothetical protein